MNKTAILYCSAIIETENGKRAQLHRPQTNQLINVEFANEEKIECDFRPGKHYELSFNEVAAPEEKTDHPQEGN